MVVTRSTDGYFKFITNSDRQKEDGFLYMKQVDSYFMWYRERKGIDTAREVNTGRFMSEDLKAAIKWFQEKKQVIPKNKRLA